MKKISISILILILIWLILFLAALQNFQFSNDAIWKIEQQRREHAYIFPSLSKFIHNKGTYFGYSIFENYLSYYSPSSLFCCNQPLILEFITLIIFYGGIFILLKTNTKLAKIVLFWILVHPLFTALTPQQLTTSLLLLLIAAPSGIFIYTLYRKIKQIFR